MRQREDKPDEDSLALLQACPFSLTLKEDTQLLQWPNLKLAQMFFKNEQRPVPESLQQFENLYAANVKAERQARIKSLIYDGARYTLTYSLNLEDSRSIEIEEIGERKTGISEIPTHISGVLRVINDRPEIFNPVHAQSRPRAVTHLIPPTPLDDTTDFMRLLAHEMSFQAPRPREGALIIMHVKNVDAIGKNFGQDALNFLIDSFAKTLKKDFIPPAIATRIAEAGFALLLPNCPPHKAREVRDYYANVLHGLAARSPHGSLPIQVLAYEGLIDGFVQDEHAFLEAVCRDAGMSIDKIKLTGEQEISPGVHEYPAGLTHRSTEITADNIHAKLKIGAFSLVFQPIVDVKTKQAVYHEGLLRHKTIDGQRESAFAYVLAAERLGLIHWLDRYVLERATDSLKLYPKLQLHLNVSIGTLNRPSTCTAYLRQLRDLGPMCERLTLELTETMGREKLTAIQYFITESRKLGCRIAIDDFGAGYTSFDNLMSLEADMIKIDGNLITGIAYKPDNYRRVRMIVDLAQTLGLETVAEFVNDPNDAKLLSRLGINYFQGFAYGAPGPLSETYLKG